MSHARRVLAAVLLIVLAAAVPAHGETCVPAGAWVVPGRPGTVPAADVLDRAARREAVLLGESHDSAEHHRWQLQVLTALHARRPNMVLAFEMFPRRVQRALDQWVAGELTEAQFLAASEWQSVWGLDPQLYMPIFHFARMNRVPMVAANISRTLARSMGQKGYDGIPESEREGVTRPARPAERYLDTLAEVYAAHGPEGKRPLPARGDAEFQRFVDVQLAWDRAMAQSIAAAARREGRPLVVGIMGRGHAEYGDGVPLQLKDLGVGDVGVLLPWDKESSCSGLVTGLADAVFGVDPPKLVAAAPRPRLGVLLEATADGVRIQRVDKGSIAETAGIRDGDVVTEIAGRRVRQAADVAEAVQRQAPGTWLPLKVRRQGETLDLVARFPAAPE